ncbi:MAG: rhodanese-like domain-containing protein [Flavobacterium sp.]|nr:MAG: rhodanese-like domain-containing protein [Flavobacterium sp.]
MNLQQEDWWTKAQEDANAVVLDVRTQEEWNRGIIPGAQNIDIYKGQGFIDEVEKLDKSKNYYVYCAAGARSGQACNVMNQLGFENAYNLVGGMSQWRGPVETP